MRNIVLLFVIFFIVKNPSVAQGLRVGLKAGLSVPKLRTSNDDGGFSSGYSTLTGPQAGLLAEYQLSKTISLQAEVNYSSQGGQKSGKQKVRTSLFASMIPSGLVLPEYVYANFESKIELAYFEIPVMGRLNFNTGPLSRISFYGGPYIGYLVKATGKSNGKSKVYVDPAQTTELTFLVGTTQVPVGVQDLTMKRDIIDECNRINYGFHGGAAYSYTFSKWEVFLEAGGTYGVKYLQKNADFGENKTGGAFVSIGTTVKL